MANKSDFTKTGFLKSYLLPALIIFLVPGFGLWFFNHVEGAYDLEIRQAILTQIRADGKMTEAQRAQAVQFYEQVRVSRILASNDPDAKDLQEQFASVKFRYAVFRWMKRVAAVCLAGAALVFVSVGIGVLFSFRSQAAQYWSLRLGWNVLRLFALLEVLGQGILLVGLSFWVTAFLFERYFVKLILVAALLAFCAVAMIIKAIFHKVQEESGFVGSLLTKDAAPTLWERVTQMASRLGIAPPDHIFVGIDDNFFVTEEQLVVGGQRYTGRSLFVSLSLLKTLSRGEADAVLAHELAHFSGEDTLYSKRISPLLRKYVCYLQALYQGGISIPVFYFMHFFWNVYQLSIGKISRQREFRADRIGSDLTSPRDLAQALVKVSAYSRYRQKVQETLFEKEENIETMDVFQRIEQGMPVFMSGSAKISELAESGTPHPYDSHPPLGKRIASLGLDPEAVLQSPVTLPSLEESWFSTIEGAATIEAEQWKAFEDFFHQAHEQSLAYRFKPEGEAEIKHVLRYFPRIEFKNSSGGTASLDYEKLTCSDWESPIPYSTIVSCKVVENWGKNQFVIEYVLPGEQKKQSRKIAHEKFVSDCGNFLPLFEKYYRRHLVAKAYGDEKKLAG